MIVFRMYMFDSGRGAVDVAFARADKDIFVDLHRGVRMRDNALCCTWRSDAIARELISNLSDVELQKLLL